MGTPEFAVPSLEMIINEGYKVEAVVTQPDKPKGRGRKLEAPPVKEIALKAGIEVLQPENIRTAEFRERMEAIGPDLIVTAAYGKILPKTILDIPPLGCINVHGSLLPRYRGAAPVHWAVINGEKVTGVTTMYMDVGMDTGDMLLKKEVEITDDMTAGELYEILARVGAEVLRETLVKIREGTLERVPQKEEEATYAPMLKKEDGLIDWTRDAVQVHNLVRGTNPWPGAYTFYKGDRLRVWKTRVVDCDYNSTGADCADLGRNGVDRSNADGIVSNGTGTVPGTILEKRTDGVIVACGKGALALMEIQFESGKRMGIESCWHNFEVGRVLGQEKG